MAEQEGGGGGGRESVVTAIEWSWERRRRNCSSLECATFQNMRRKKRGTLLCFHSFLRTTSFSPLSSFYVVLSHMQNINCKEEEEEEEEELGNKLLLLSAVAALLPFPPVDRLQAASPPPSLLLFLFSRELKSLLATIQRLPLPRARKRYCLLPLLHRVKLVFEVMS